MDEVVYILTPQFDIILTGKENVKNWPIGSLTFVDFSSANLMRLKMLQGNYWVDLSKIQ